MSITVNYYNVNEKENLNDQTYDVQSLRRIPMGDTLSGFEYLKNMDSKEFRVYCVLQQVSIPAIEERNTENDYRYVYKSEFSYPDIAKLASTTRQTVSKVIQSLVNKGFIELDKLSNDEEIYKIPNTKGTYYALANFDVDLFKLLEWCNGISAKVYLYHCFTGELHKDKCYSYQRTLQQIAKAVGCTKLNIITKANEHLERLGVIKMYKYSDGSVEHIRYVYNAKYKERWEEYKKAKAVVEKKLTETKGAYEIQEEGLTDWCPW